MKTNLIKTANTRWKNLISFDDDLDKGNQSFPADGPATGNLVEEINSPSDPEDNLPLAQKNPSATTPEGHKQCRGSDTKKKLVAGGNLYRRATNRKNGEPYFNLVKKDISDSSDHTITLDNGEILRNSDLAIEGKLLPGPKNCGEPTIHRAQVTLPFRFSRKEEAISPKKTSPQRKQGRAPQERADQRRGWIHQQT